ncbi:uncharacterized protein LOC128744300 [Sabethes cyaneus]|uniref:uncharacterized protein LOC128744300 n=1 Tax=Sabethes cyaneus TaxID=53552 RepID=UPI00237E59F9|nr:uncharacterized protein LOC128744300 [Sabethes cyaneus]
MMREKKSMHNRLKKDPNRNLKKEYNSLHNRFKARHRALRLQHVNNVQVNLKSNPEKFWSYVNRKRKDKGTPVNVTYQGRNSSDSQQATDLFATYFKNAYRNENLDQFEHLSVLPNNFELSELSLEEISNKIDKLDAKKGSSPDGIPNELLKMWKSGLIYPLHILFNKSLQHGYFTGWWKISHIVPIHKKGSKLNVENYRGIAILSAIPKLFESLVYDRLYLH